MVHKNKIKVSIITVVYNGISSIERTIRSVINQSYKNIEFIIIDGKSTDGTIEVIKSYSKYINYWISETDKGVYDAMNKALKHATGDFLIFINANDILYSNNVIENIVHKITDTSAVYYGNAISINNQGNEFVYRGGRFDKYRLAKTNICHQTILYPKPIYKNYTYDTIYNLFADWNLNIRLFRKYKFTYLNLPIAQYDTNGISSSSNDLLFKKNQYSLVLKHLGIDCFLYIYIRKVLKSICRK